MYMGMEERGAICLLDEQVSGSRGASAGVDGNHTL